MNTQSINRDQDVDVEAFRELFWEQYPIEGTVRFDGELVEKFSKSFYVYVLVSINRLGVH